MKTLYVLTFCLWVHAVMAQEKEKMVQSQVKDVTVFLEGAQITREVPLEVPAGVVTWVITGVSHHINEQSLQAQIPLPVKILSVSFRINYLNHQRKPESNDELEKSKVKLVSALTQENNVIDVYREELNMLLANKGIGGQHGINVAELKSAVEYFRSRMLDIKKLIQTSEEKRDEYARQIKNVDAQIEELKHPIDQPVGEVLVKTSSKSSLKSVLRLSYLSLDARWFPTYDIRAHDVQSPLALTYKANVSQQTGEDWNQVRLTISTGNPSISGSRPILDPWYLGFNNRSVNATKNYSYGVNGFNPQEIVGRITSAEDGMPMVGVNVVIKGTTVGTVSDVKGEFRLQRTSDARVLVFSFIGMQTEEVPIENRSSIDISMNTDVTQLSEVVVTALGISGDSENSQEYVRQPRVKKTIVATPVIRQTHIEYTVDEPYTILSDGELRSVEMVEYEMKTLYQYYCVPKLNHDAFLVAQITNWDEYNLLEGEVNLYFEEKYIGKSILDTRNTSDTLSLSLGRDADVVVTREKVKDYSSNQFFSGQRKVQITNEILIRNKKKYPIQIRIEDQLPVPNTKEITVEKVKDSQATYSEESGLLTWNKKIEPGKTDKLVVQYVVKSPRYNSLLLE